MCQISIWYIFAIWGVFLFGSIHRSIYEKKECGEREEEETEYIVGEDIAPGRYTVRYEGEGTSVLSIRTQTGTFDEYFSLSCAKYSPESTQYMGLVLKEGDIVYIQKYGSDEAMAEFMPLTKPLDGYYQN